MTNVWVFAQEAAGAPTTGTLELLTKARGPVFALELIRQVTPALATLQLAADGVSHGALSADRIVVVRSGTALAEEARPARCRRHLTGYKLPRIVESRNEPLPKTNLGKILRRELRTVVTTRSKEAA